MKGLTSLYWLTQTTADVAAGDDWLSPAERSVLEEKKFLKRRADWRLGRWTAKRALRAFFAFYSAQKHELSYFEIRAAADGAPEVFLSGRKESVSISISHSEGRGLCVLSKDAGSVGCDVEKIIERSESFLFDFFTAGEVARVLEHAADERPLVSTLLWCAKESALKTVREGLRRDTRSVEAYVDLGDANAGWNPLSVTCTETSVEYGGWWRRMGEFVLAVTAEGAVAEPVELILA